MANGAYALYVIPIIFTIVFSTFVMVGALDELERELHLWPIQTSGTHSEGPLEISGLLKQYSTSQPIQIQVDVKDSTFDCGDLYVTIYSSPQKNVISQNTFFAQCFTANNSLLPIDNTFTEIVDTSGDYILEVEMKDKSLKKTVNTSAKFTVK